MTDAIVVLGAGLGHGARQPCGAAADVCFCGPAIPLMSPK